MTGRPLRGNEIFLPPRHSVIARRAYSARRSNPTFGIPSYSLRDCSPAKTSRGGVVATYAPRNDGTALRGKETFPPLLIFRHCEEGVLRPTTLAPHCVWCSAGEQSNFWHTKIFIVGLLPGESSRGNDGGGFRVRYTWEDFPWLFPEQTWSIQVTLSLPISQATRSS
jgi:hypothetical protein